MERHYYWQFSDGKNLWLTQEEALKYRNKHRVTSMEPIADSSDERAFKKKFIRNGFKETVAGQYHPYFKCRIRGMEHFKELCKIHNVDVAGEKHTEKDFVNEKFTGIDVETVKFIRQTMDCDAGDVAMDALIRGEKLEEVPEPTPN